MSSITELLGRCAINYGRELSGDQLDNYERLFTDLTPEAMEKALDAHMQDPDRGNWFPLPSDIRRHSNRLREEHPPADLAWSRVLESFDENVSVLWTTLMQRARDAALPAWNSGDKVAARMAFKAGYQQLVDRSTGAPVWKLSVGNDPAQRAEAVDQALAAGLIGENQAAQLLPDLSEATGPVAQIAGVVADKAEQFTPPKTSGAGKRGERAFRDIAGILKRPPPPTLQEQRQQAEAAARRKANGQVNGSD